MAEQTLTPRQLYVSKVAITALRRAKTLGYPSITIQIDWRKTPNISLSLTDEQNEEISGLMKDGKRGARRITMLNDQLQRQVDIPDLPLGKKPPRVTAPQKNPEEELGGLIHQPKDTGSGTSLHDVGPVLSDNKIVWNPRASYHIVKELMLQPVVHATPTEGDIDGGRVMTDSEVMTQKKLHRL